ncbi:MAG: BspA family leucine-rich repeat surface protein [Bacteroidota bacterium]
MKKVFLFLLFFAALASVAVGQNANDWFITVWEAPASGTIRFAVAINGQCTLRCVELDPITGNETSTVQTFSWAVSNQPINNLIPGRKYRIYAYGYGLKVISFRNGYAVPYKDCILKVEQWGTTVWDNSLSGAFFQCTKMDITATDVPNLSSVNFMNMAFAGCSSLVNANGSMANWDVSFVKEMSGMFTGATSFNQPISNWNTSNVTKMDDMFSGATSFNQPLNWNTRNVYNMANMFRGASSFNQVLDKFELNSISTFYLSYMDKMLTDCGMSCENLSATLNHFKDQAIIHNKHNQSFGAFSTNQYYNDIGQAAINALKAIGWNISGGTHAYNCVKHINWFRTEWKAPANGTIKFPAVGNGYTILYYRIDPNTKNPLEAPHYINSANSGEIISGLFAGKNYRIFAFGGTFNQLSFSTYPDNKDDILAVEQWGTTEWSSFALAFYECSNMDVIAIDKPNLTSCANLDRMFFGCTSLVNANSSISSWITDNVVVLGGMFAGATKFNKPLNWNTANVQTMAWMFSGAVAFNQPINFDTRNVLDMGHMFVGASAFNSPFGSNWNTEKVTNMESMFRDATVFDQPIGNWNTSLVVDMKRMFEMARAFNQDISGWNTEKVKNMGGMFNGAVAFNQPIGGWNTQSLESTFAMFWGATSFNKPLNWNTQNVTDMYGMFNGATSFDSQLTFSNTANVINMMNMFNGATSFNQQLTFNTQSVTNMSAMFYNAHSFNSALNFSNTQNVATTAAMFYNALAFDQPIGNWNLQSATDMSFMFQGAVAFNQPINFNTQSATSMKGMFSGAAAFNQPFGSNFNTQNVTDMSYMFDGATAFDQPIDGFRINAVTTMTDMLKGCGMNCQNLTSALNSWKTQATALSKNNIDLGTLNSTQTYSEAGKDAINTLKTNFNWTINGGSIILGCAAATDYYVSEWDLSKPVWPARSDAATTLVTNLVGGEFTLMWENLNNPSDNGFVTIASGTPTNPCKIPGLTAGAKYRVVAFSPNPAGLTGLCAEKADYQRLTKVTQWGTTQWTSLTKAFMGCGNMDITATDKPDLSAVTDLTSMFQNCTSLEYNSSINDWDVSNVTNMSQMFAGALKFNQPLNSWNVSNVTNMSQMFAEAIKFNQPLNNWVVSNVTNMSYMFGAAIKFNQNINSWNVSNVTDMMGMFTSASVFNQPLNNWVTSKVTNMQSMFGGAEAFNQDINSWDVSKVTNMSMMFNYAKAFNKPLNNWDVSKVTDMSSMFRYTDLFNQDITGWNVSAVTNMQSMFERALVFNQDIKGWNTSNVTDMQYMFKQAAVFDRNLGSLRIDALTNGTEMFASSGMSCDNYSKTLKGWAESSNTPSNVNFITQTGIAYGRHGKQYRHKLTSLKNWTISGDNLDLACSIGLITPDVYISEWDMSKPAKDTRPDAATTLFTNFLGTNFVVEYINLADPTDKGIELNANGVLSTPFELTGLRANAKYRLIAYANPGVPGSVFTELNAINSDSKRLTKVNQWGINVWTLLSNAFRFCENMDVTATDTPNLSACQNLNAMFTSCASLVNANGSISGWNTQNVTSMGSMFAGATSFNQPLNFNTKKVTLMGLMFKGATSFNQPLDSFKINAISYMSDMFKDCGMSCENLSSTLDSWKTQAAALNKNNVPLGDISTVSNAYNQTGQAAITALQARSWTITGGTYAEDCITPTSWFTTVWDLTKPTNRTNSPNTTIAFPGYGTNYRIDWEDVDNPTLAGHHGTVTVPLSSATSPYYLAVPSGITKVRIKAHKAGGTFYNFMQTYQNSNKPDSKRLITVEQWGTTKWTSLYYAFYSCENMDVTATDVPDLSTCQYLSGMFSGCTSLVNTNGSISGWNTANVTSMWGMFYGATSFNQPLDSFKIDAVTTNMENMLQGSGISCENLSTTLDSWKRQAAAQNKNNINLGDITTVHNMYNEMGQAAIAALTTRGWTISGGRFAPGCVSPDSYVSEWDMSKPATTGTATNLVTNLWGSSFRVEWKNLDDGTTGAAIATTTTAPYTITGLTAGKRYRVVAYADPSNPSSTFSKLATMKGGGYTTITDAQRLDSVTQWGTNRWTSLDSAFFLCSRMDVTATDVPDLRGVKDLSYMFGGCDSLVYNPTINTWRTDSITNMEYMFGEDKKFNQPLGSWNTERVTNMHGMFQGTHKFDQDIHNWNTGKVTDMSQMFIRAFKFNQPIGSWNTANVTGMGYMFAFATSFNKPLYWNVEKVTDMTSMFWGADAFDQDLSYWTLKNVTSAGDMFKADLNKGMSCGNYSETLQGWAINPLTKTGLNFGGQDNRQYNMIGKESRDILTKPIANGGKGWTVSGDTYDKNCGIDYVWTGAVSTNIADNGNWQGGQHPGSSPILGEFRATVAFDSLAVRDMHIPSLPYTPPGSTPNYIHFYSFGNLINNSNKKVVIEPNGHLHINKWVFGSSTPADVDKIVVKADDTNPNGSLILAGQPCDKPVYATVEMYSKANREATAMTWTDNIPSSPTKDSLFSVHYRWQYIGIPVAGEYANAFYGSYLRKYDETYNDPNHYYGKWRKLGADETWQPLVPFAGYEVTSRTPKVYVFKGRLLHCPQELTLTRQAAEVSAVPSSFTDPRERRWELGHNVFGNSYTSALMIGQGKLFVDLEGRYPLGQEPIEGTVYVYNTGSIADWAGGGTLGSGPGQYVAVPVFSATALSEQYISSMQGFMLKFKEDTLRINGVGSPVKFRIGLNKEEHYLSDIYPFGGNQRPQRAPQAAPSDKIHGYLKVGLTSRRSVSSVHLIEAEGTTDEFDNGWDGMQLNTGRSSSATLFVPSEYGDLQVSTSDNIVGDRFGIVNNGDTTYRLTVIRHRLDNRGELYLYDVATNRYTLLDSDTTVYDFTSEGSGNVDKRFVITDRRNADDPNTAVDEAAEDMSLYGYVDGRHTLVVNNHTAEAGMLTLLDVSGKVVYTSPFGVGFSRHDLSHLPAGVYIARLEASVRRATVKAITMK